MRLAVRLGILMLAYGAQAQEVEPALRGVLRGLGLSEADAIVMTVQARRVVTADPATGGSERTSKGVERRGTRR